MRPWSTSIPWLWQWQGQSQTISNTCMEGWSCEQCLTIVNDASSCWQIMADKLLKTPVAVLTAYGCCYASYTCGWQSFTDLRLTAPHRVHFVRSFPALWITIWDSTEGGFLRDFCTLGDGTVWRWRRDRSSCTPQKKWCAVFCDHANRCAIAIWICSPNPERLGSLQFFTRILTRGPWPLVRHRTERWALQIFDLAFFFWLFESREYETLV